MKISNLSALMLMTSMLLGITSCSNDINENAAEVPDGDGSALFLAPNVSLPESEEAAPLLRSTFYNGAKSGVCFDWETYVKETGKGDVVGIVSVPDGTDQLRFECRSVSTLAEEASDGVSKALFKQEDASFEWALGQNYRAYYPYMPEATDITAVPMDYTGQQQTGKPDMSAYFGKNLQTYYDSERAASIHLTEKSFMLSAPSQPEENKGLTFKMNHLGGIVRFYLAMPVADGTTTISEVCLVATKPVFHEHATLNVQNGETTPIGDPTNSLVLKLTDASLSGDAYGHYLVAYMMAYPANLTGDDVLGTTGKLYIYAKGKNNIKGDVFFRSGAVTKKDIAAGVLTSFALKTTANEDPIDVQPITIQEWEAGLTMDNDGMGTEDW